MHACIAWIGPAIRALGIVRTTQVVVPSGGASQAAPIGAHDDCVTAHHMQAGRRGLPPRCTCHAEVMALGFSVKLLG